MFDAKKILIYFAYNKKTCTFALALRKHVDPLAQLVEHNTCNVGVVGSSPKRITKRRSSVIEDLFFMLHPASGMMLKLC